MNHVIEQDRPQATPLPGVAHTTLAGHALGLKQLSVWRQLMDPGCATPPHRHDCDEVVLCLGGRGEVHIDGKAHRFDANCTVLLPANCEHQIFNVGPQPLETLGIFAATPVVTRGLDGTALPLPWQS